LTCLRCGQYFDRATLGIQCCTFGFVLKEAINLADGTVENNDSEAVVGDVHDQVLAHDGQADEAEVSTGLGLRS
jgi:hypothetical protein